MDNGGKDDSFGSLLCHMCKVKKPVDEFPYQTVSKHCEHARLECLRCVVKYVNEHGKCPNEKCDITVDKEDGMVKFFQAKLDTVFVDYNKVLEKRTEMIKSAGEFISVSTITGNTEWLQYKPDMKIADLKRDVAQKLELNEKHLRLIYDDQNLKSGAKLSDYKMGPYSNIFVIVPLYCVPEHLDNVVFDLSWEFPDVNPDFLDATCFAFEKEEFVQVIDWTHPTNKYYLKDSIKQSEKNVTSAGQKTGHQTIHVSLKAVPCNITHLYFTLSSWRSPSLSAFKNPSLKFYETSEENVNLCETTISHALSSQAVIMCSAVREGDRQWQIFECSVRSVVEGNSKRYNPIRARISELIRDGL
ncbi:hypothetical protein ACF0H5_006758 [Mactra antiquata]